MTTLVPSHLIVFERDDTTADIIKTQLKLTLGRVLQEMNVSLCNVCVCVCTVVHGAMITVCLPNLTSLMGGGFSGQMDNAHYSTIQ